jgi:hypothetical protein
MDGKKRPGEGAYPPDGTEISELLRDLASRREFRAAEPGADLFLPGLRLHGAQLFIRGFTSPDTPWPRLLINWQTGTGKSIAAISIAQEFIRQFRARAALGERAPTVFVISFTARDTIQEDMLRYPEFGFVSAAEVEELRRLRAGGDPRALSSLMSVLRRRISDRSREGYYQFYGYREFANRLLRVTPRGLAAGFDVAALFGRGAFGEGLAAAVKRGDLVVDEELLEEMRGGLLVCDEIHNTYNIHEKNNYGTAIQYALDALGDEAPRAVFMSATPMTGSAAEIVDLLNLLVPRAALPGGLPLSRGDFFSRAEVEDSATAKDGGATTTKDSATAKDGGAPAAKDSATAKEDGAPAAKDKLKNDEPAKGRDRAADDDEEPERAVVTVLKPGALEQISRLAAGRVSFLLDSDVGSYPRRVFVGDPVPGVPYLRFTPCPMSPFHERTLAHAQAGGDPARGLPPGSYTLYDMAFPNPQFAPDAAAGGDPGAYGLYLSRDTPFALDQAPADWRAAAGVAVEKAEHGGRIITGPFLQLDQLRHYSTKYCRLLEATLAAVRGGPGKIMIYHHRVHMSGVLLLQEALRMNGFADETSLPTDATLCAVCGVPRGKHADNKSKPKSDKTNDGKAGDSGENSASNSASNSGSEAHEYTPARFVVAHSDVDRPTMMRSIAKFNALSNLTGSQYRVLIGSRIIRESLNFRAVRHQFIVSLPTDYSTLIQVFGRVCRKGSHADLPQEQRQVEIRLFATARADGQPSPELRRYIAKGREYLVIQEVDRALHANAVDGFANYGRISRALAGNDASIDSLPYAPLLTPAAAAALPARSATFLAYGHGEREVALIGAVCRALYRRRAVWTYEDLWAAVREYRADFDEDNFAAALVGLARPAGAPPVAVLRAGRFYVRAVVADGRPALDIESHVRGAEATAAPAVSVRLDHYVRAAKSGQNFAVRLRELERLYLGPDAPRALELSLLAFSGAFHCELIRRLVTEAGGRGGQKHGAVTSDDRRVLDLYRRFRVAVTAADCRMPGAVRAFRGSAARGDDVVGYVTAASVVLHDGREWYDASLQDFAIGRRHRENDIIVGFVADGDSVSAEPKFKIRPPIQRLAAEISRREKVDIRGLSRGAVCETRPREELAVVLRQLRDAAARHGVRPATGGGCGCNNSDDITSEYVGAEYDITSEYVGGNTTGGDTTGGDTTGGDTTGGSTTDGDTTDNTTSGGSAADLKARLDFAARYDRAALKRYPSATEMCDSLRLYLLALEESARAPASGMTTGTRWLYLFNDAPPSIASITTRAVA